MNDAHRRAAAGKGAAAGETAAKQAAAREPNWFRDELPSLLVVIAAALAIRTFVFQTFYVPSESMLPTLLVGDHVFVNKFVFGPQLPGADWRLPDVREPRRGEVIVFRFARGNGGIYPADARPDLPTDNFVKRLVGLPGDRIAYQGGRLLLNGKPVPLEDTPWTFHDEYGRELRVRIEALGECRHFVLDQPEVPDVDVAEVTVPEGRYFFMGDNRENSHDSRYVGSVRQAELAGPAGLNYWSWDWNGGWLSLLNPLTWIENLATRMRWSRMGSFVECFPDGEPVPAPGAE